MGKTGKCKFTLPFPMPKCVQCLRIYCWRVCGCWRWRGNCANCVPTWRPPGVVMLQPASSPAAHTVMTRTGSETPAPRARQLQPPASRGDDFHNTVELQMMLKYLHLPHLPHLTFLPLPRFNTLFSTSNDKDKPNMHGHCT